MFQHAIQHAIQWLIHEYYALCYVLLLGFFSVWFWICTPPSHINLILPDPLQTPAYFSDYLHNIQVFRWPYFLDFSNCYSKHWPPPIYGIQSCNVMGWLIGYIPPIPCLFTQRTDPTPIPSQKTQRDNPTKDHNSRLLCRCPIGLWKHHSWSVGEPVVHNLGWLIKLAPILIRNKAREAATLILGWPLPTSTNHYVELYNRSNKSWYSVLKACMPSSLRWNYWMIEISQKIETSHSWAIAIR